MYLYMLLLSGMVSLPGKGFQSTRINKSLCLVQYTFEILAF